MQRIQVIDTAKLAFGRYYKYSCTNQDTAKEGVGPIQLLNRSPIRSNFKKSVSQKNQQQVICKHSVKVNSTSLRNWKAVRIEGWRVSFCTQRQSGNVIEL